MVVYVYRDEETGRLIEIDDGDELIVSGWFYVDDSVDECF